MSSTLSIGLIGAGTLGKSLALGLATAGYRVTAVASRTYASAETLAEMIPGCTAVRQAQELVDRCDLVFVTTTDEAVSRVVADLRWSPGQGVAHCSGSGSLDLLLPAVRMGARCGSLHPFQTFAGIVAPQDALERFRGITFAVEGDGWLLETLEGVAVDLGGRVIRLNANDRSLYHASAVMSCGYLVALLKAAAEIWRHIGVTEEEGVQAMLPLARATLENVASMGPDGAVTGPMVRGDADTLQGHLEALKARLPDLLPLYLALSRASLPLAAPRVEGERLREMKNLISEYMPQP